MIKTVGDLKKALEAYPDDMIVQGWNDDQGYFHDIRPEIQKVVPAHFKESDGDEYDSFVDWWTMEYKEHPDKECPDFGCWDRFVRTGPETEILTV